MLITKQYTCTSSNIKSWSSSQSNINTYFVNNVLYVTTDTKELFICILIDDVKTLVQLTMDPTRLLGGITFKAVLDDIADLPESADNGDLYLVTDETGGYAEYIYVDELGSWESIGSNANLRDNYISSIGIEGKVITFNYLDGRDSLSTTLPDTPKADYNVRGIVKPSSASFSIEDDGSLKIKNMVFSYPTLTELPTIDGTTIRGNLISNTFLKYDDTTLLKDKIDDTELLTIEGSINFIPNVGVADTETSIVLNGRALTDAEKENTKIPEQWRTAGVLPNTEILSTTQSSDLSVRFSIIGVLKLS